MNTQKERLHRLSSQLKGFVLIRAIRGQAPPSGTPVKLSPLQTGMETEHEQQRADDSETASPGEAAATGTGRAPMHESLSVGPFNT